MIMDKKQEPIAKYNKINGLNIIESVVFKIVEFYIFLNPITKCL